MAILDDKIEQAYYLSSNALKGSKWDTEAFIVASLIRLMGKDVDIVPESQIDEMTDISKDMFAKFMHTKSDDDLHSYMMQIIQMITELYFTVSANQKNIIVDAVAKLNSLV